MTAEFETARKADSGYGPGTAAGRSRQTCAVASPTEQRTGNPDSPGLMLERVVTSNIRLAVKGFGYSAGSWRVDKHLRLMADITGDGRADVVGFGEGKVWVSLAQGDGSYSAANVALQAFCFSQGWRVDRHPRFLADTTGDGTADIVGCGEDGVWVARSQGNGQFEQPRKVGDNFGYSAGAGSWRMESNPRLMADITGDGRADLVGFAGDKVWVSLAQGDGTFSAPIPSLIDFCTAQGWRVDRHPRFLADTTGDGTADIVGCGEDGVWVARSQGNGQFEQPRKVGDNFGYSAGAGSWRMESNPRLMADITGDGRADLVGFAGDKVWVSLAQGDGTFSAPIPSLIDFCTAQGWRVDRHPRFLADTTGDGTADIVGCGDGGVWVARSQGNGQFEQPRKVVDDFGYSAGGWRTDKHPRFVADTNGDGRAEIVGFGEAGVLISQLG
ncbi:VCBS repeat-containing protein [Micromonospora sp. NBC_00389]|uniref:FG-GAP repeat domain-containing protein n=1 Tax=Micromonospora sp. NBC_00389 TaxID=2903586 RepID=UPI002E1A07F3